MKKIPVAVALFLLAACGTVHAAETTVESDGMLNVDGTRVFVVGLYENPAEDAELARAAEAGFNLVRSSADTAALDRLQRYGVHAWVNTGAAIDLSEDTDTRRGALQSMTDTLNAHPAMLVWEVPDEALWNCWYEAQMWRRSAEPAEQHKHINALADESARGKLQAQRAQVDALYHKGNYAEAEALSDDLWRQMGLEPPRPGYGLGNASERAAKMCGGMREGYALLKALAGRPVWMNHAPRNQIEQLAAFNEAADIVGCDIYPVPVNEKVGHSDLSNRSMSCVGDYTRRMAQAAPGKPVWMVLQGFGWGDIQPDKPEDVRKELRPPTLEETRYMAFDASVHGARGILYWGSHAVEKVSTFYGELLAFVAELRDLQPVLAAPDAVLDITVSYQPTYGSVDRAATVLAKASDGAPWLFVVNEWTNPLACDLRGLESLNGTRYWDRLSGGEAEVKDGTLSLKMTPQSVQILEPLTRP